MQILSGLGSGQNPGRGLSRAALGSLGILGEQYQTEEERRLRAEQQAKEDERWERNFGLQERGFTSQEEARKFQQDMAMRNYQLNAGNAARGTYDSKLHAYVLPNGQVVPNCRQAWKRTACRKTLRT